MTPGILDMTHQQYLEAPAINKSALDQVAKSPAHYKAWLEEPQEPTEAMVFGTAAHRLILEPELFERTTVVAPVVDRRTKVGKETWEAFCAQNVGKLVLTDEQSKALKRMSENWLTHPLCRGIQTHAQYEKSAFWKDPVTGLLCKARADIIHGSGMILDLKTTDSAIETEFQKSVAKWRYHVQAAWYVDGFKQAVGENFHSFLFIAMEKKAPFAISIFMADHEMIDIGRRLYRENLDLLASCLEADHFPAYPTDIRPLQLPRWAL